MPALGMAQETGRLVRWLKREGEQVTKGEPLMEVETDKAVVEVESPGAGILSGVKVHEGEEVPVGTVIAYLLAPAARPSAPSLERPARAAASPKARRLAAERGLDLARMQGTGPDGAVVEADVLGLAPEPVQAAGSRPAAEVHAPMAGAMWRAMAERTARDWREVPHFFLFREADASQLIVARARAPAGVTYTDLLVRLAALTLVRHPIMNAGRREVSIALAVAADQGLIAPVIAGPDRLDLAALAARRAELVDRARSGRMRAQDLAQASFTVSNLGMFGVDAFLPIVSEGQAGILGVGRIADRVVPVQGRPQVRPVLALSLSCDHRLVDGARAARFLADLAQAIEEPAGVL
jgi:pyruvate dehydrogenase E2 component (dihydrolipoamide acetyltransferase)